MLRRLNPLLLAAVHRPWCTRLMAPPQHRTVTPEPIHTDRLALLPLAVEHAEEMALALVNPGLHTFIGGAPADASALRVRYERLVAGPADPSVSWCNWTIELRAEKCLVGTVQATVNASHELRTPLTLNRALLEVAVHRRPRRRRWSSSARRCWR